MGTTTPGYPVDVVSSTGGGAGVQIRAESTGSTRAQINIDNAAGGQQSALSLLDAGAQKWQIGKQTDNTFFLWDQANSRNTIVTNGSGDFILQGSGGRIGIGANSNTPLATLDIRPNIGTLAVASISGKTSFASLVVDNSGVGDLFTASSSGLSRFVITQAGNIGYWDNVPK